MTLVEDIRPTSWTRACTSNLCCCRQPPWASPASARPAEQKAHHMAPLRETAWYSYCPSTKPRACSLWPLAEWSRPSACSSSTSRVLGALPQPPWSPTDPCLSDFALSLCTVSISQFVSSQCFTSLTYNMPLWKHPWYCCLPVLFTIPPYFITFYLLIISLCIWQ